VREQDDFDNIFDKSSPEKERGRSQRFALQEGEADINVDSQKLSSVLENSLCIKFSEACTECEQPLREEELLSGL